MEGTSLEGEDHSIGEGRWGNREGQLGDRSVSCPEAEEGSHMGGKVGAAGRATAGWVEGSFPEVLPGVHQERRGRHEGVWRPVRSNVSDATMMIALDSL